MCGRYTLTVDKDILEQYFLIENMDEITYEISYNVAPSQNAFAVINHHGKNKAGLLKWGLVPSWAKDPSIGYKMINARSETIDQKPSFKHLLSRRRCLIIADSFYEWKLVNGEKKPFRFSLKTNQPFAFAGLWDRWQQEDNLLTTCTIITTNPNELVQQVHDRMPVILPKEAEMKWLDRNITDGKVLKSLLIPYAHEEMEVYQVSELVNSPKNNNRKCIEAI